MKKGSSWNHSHNSFEIKVHIIGPNLAEQWFIFIAFVIVQWEIPVGVFIVGLFIVGLSYVLEDSSR